MKFTKLQFKVLKTYAEYHSGPLTLGKVMRKFWIMVLVPIYFAGCGAFLIWRGWESFGWLSVGMGIGISLRYVNQIQVLLRTWPLIEQITNWQRVSELLGENNPPPSLDSY